MRTPPRSDDARSSGGGSKKGERSEEAAQRFGKYDITRMLGRGGMGKVYLGVDRDLKRTVAIKFLSKEKAQNPQLVKRFKAEGQAAANLNHENIVRVFDSGDIKGQLFLALEYVEGKDAHQMLTARGRFPVSRSIEIITKVALALEHASKHGIVHRDIKPSNIMIRQDGEIKLADLGLARSLEEAEDAGITRAGTTVGTVDYMSPEQARDSKSADLRSDIYSLGATWYQLITGQPPFADGDLTNKLRAHATAKRPDPADLNDQVSESVSAVIARMMAVNPEDRYQTVAELLEDLAAIKGNHTAVLSAVLGDIGDSVAPGGLDYDIADEDDVDEEWEEDDDWEEEDGDWEDQPGSEDRPSKRRAGRRSSRRVGGDAVEEDDVDAGGRPSKRSKEKGEKNRRRKSGKAARNGAADDSDAGGTTKQRKKRRGGDQNDSADSGRRRGKKSKTAESSSAAPSKKRALPPRAEGEVRESRKLDPDLIRNIVIGGCILSLFGGIVWFVSSQSGGSTPAEDVAVWNPNAVQQESGLVQKVRDAADGDPAIDDPDSTQENDGPPTTSVGSPDRAANDPDRDAIAKLPPLAPQKGVAFPDWVGQERLSMLDVPTRDVLNVRRSNAERGDFRSLQEAVEAVTTSGATIVIHERGPHRLVPTTVRETARLNIMAAGDDVRPIVECVGGADGAAVIAATHTDVLLSGIDFFFRSRQKMEGRRRWMTLDAGQLKIHNCSLTDVSQEQDAAFLEITVGKVASAVNRRHPGRVLVTDSTFRGAATTPLVLATPMCDVVVGNCYIDSGTQPAVRYSSAAGLAARPRGNKAPPQRNILIAGTTAFGEQSFMVAEQSGKIAPAPVLLAVEQCLIGCPTREPAAAVLRLTNWPGQGDKPTNLKTYFSKTTLANWDALASWERESAQPRVAGDPVAWRKWFPESTILANQLSDAVLEAPLRVETSEDVAEFSSRWRKAIAAKVGASLLQADLERTPWPMSGYGDRFADLAAWPTPADLRAPIIPNSAEPQTFDLSKTKLLGPYLKSSSVPDGAIVRVVGEGRIDLSNVELGAKRVRVVCDQTGDGIRFNVRTNKRSTPPCFKIAGGKLELVNAILELKSSVNSGLPTALFEMDGGTLALRNCRIIDAAASRDAASLVRSTSAGAKVIATDSWLIGPGAAVSGDNGVQFSADNSALFVGQSVARGNATVHLQHCSVRSGGTILDAGKSTDLSAWAERCVFAPAKAVVAANDAAVLRSIVWYGYENLFANGSSTTARGDSSGPTLTEQSWAKAWPAGRVAQVRVGPLGEFGVGESPQELARDDLVLSDSEATGKTSDGRRPGVDPDRVGLVRTAAETKPRGTPTRPKGPLLPF